MFESIQAADQAWLHVIQQALTGPTQAFFAVVTLLGHPIFWLAVATVLYWTRREKQAFFLVNLLVFSSAIVGILKVTVARPRPSPAEFTVAQGPSVLKQLEQGFDFSFPSGHATTIAAVVGYYSKKYRRTLLLGLGITAVLLVGLSRLVLGLHFPSDVLVGIVLGWFLGKIVWKIQAKFEQHAFRLSKSTAETGLVVALLAGLLALVLVERPLFVAVLAGFYAGFFLLQEIRLKQTVLHHSLEWLKIGVGGLTLFLIAIAGLFFADSLMQSLLFFGAGFWVSFLYPWLFEKALREDPKIDISFQRPRK